MDIEEDQENVLTDLARTLSPITNHQKPTMLTTDQVEQELARIKEEALKDDEWMTMMNNAEEDDDKEMSDVKDLLKRLRNAAKGVEPIKSNNNNNNKLKKKKSTELLVIPGGEDAEQLMKLSNQLQEKHRELLLREEELQRREDAISSRESFIKRSCDRELQKNAETKQNTTELQEARQRISEMQTNLASHRQQGKAMRQSLRDIRAEVTKLSEENTRLKTRNAELNAQLQQLQGSGMSSPSITAVARRRDTSKSAKWAQTSPPPHMNSPASLSDCSNINNSNNNNNSDNNNLEFSMMLIKMMMNGGFWKLSKARDCCPLLCQSLINHGRDLCNQAKMVEERTAIAELLAWIVGLAAPVMNNDDGDDDENIYTNTPPREQTIVQLMQCVAQPLTERFEKGSESGKVILALMVCYRYGKHGNTKLIDWALDSLQEASRVDAGRRECVKWHASEILTLVLANSSDATAKSATALILLRLCPSGNAFLNQFCNPVTISNLLLIVNAATQQDVTECVSILLERISTTERGIPLLCTAEAIRILEDAVGNMEASTATSLSHFALSNLKSCLGRLSLVHPNTIEDDPVQDD